MPTRNPIVDSFGRVHTNLRISVTDRCNIRCFYCMPAEDVEFRPRHELLTFEEITRFVTVAATMGVDRLRITGGEPLVRAEIPSLVRMLSETVGIKDIALTTNGILLDEVAGDLFRAGLTRLNVSLDTLDEATFQHISRRAGLQRVLDGIFAARSAGFEKIRLNALAIRDLTEKEIVPLAEFAREHDLELRFIEYMPLDAAGSWQSKQVLRGAEIAAILTDAFGPLEPVERPDPSQPAIDYRFADGRGRIGFINPVSEPFCGDCNRLRLTADGQVRNCLFSSNEWDARTVLRRADSTDDEMAELIYASVAAKQPGHGIDSPEFLKPQRAMYQIGG
jgi:cyclic pyranopterin phosphate synthase